MRERINCIPHGRDEVVVVFNENDTLRNHLLRGVPNLAARYAALEAEAVSLRADLESTIAAAQGVIVNADPPLDAASLAEQIESHSAEAQEARANLETRISPRRAAIDADAFALAESEIAKAEDDAKEKADG